jgi:hypothetical protein
MVISPFKTSSTKDFFLATTSFHILSRLILTRIEHLIFVREPALPELETIIAKHLQKKVFLLADVESIVL